MGWEPLLAPSGSSVGPAPAAPKSLARERLAPRRPSHSEGLGQVSPGGCSRDTGLGRGDRVGWENRSHPAPSSPSRVMASYGHPQATRARPHPGRVVFGRPPTQGRIPELLPPILGSRSGRGARVSISVRRGRAEGHSLLRTSEPGDKEVVERAPL